MSCTPRLVVCPRPQCRTRKRSAVPGRAWTTVARSRAVDDRQHRVAAGRRVVGQHHDRPAVGRAPGWRPCSRPSLGSSSVTRRSSGGPSRRTPTRLTSGETVYGDAGQLVEGIRREPVAAWPGPHADRRRSIAGGGAWSTTIGVPGSAPTGSRSPAVTGGRAEAGAGVLAARAEHGRDVDRRRGRRGSPRGSRPAGSTATVSPAATARAARSAAVATTVAVRRSDAQPARASPARRRPRALPTSRLSTARSDASSAPLSGNAELGVPGSPGVLDARRPPGLDDDAARSPGRHEAHRVARADQRRLGRAPDPTAPRRSSRSGATRRATATGRRPCTRRRWPRRRRAHGSAASARRGRCSAGSSPVR